MILANSGLFLASVILQNAGVVDWHSASFVEDGFCVTAPKTWRSSHAMSFYADAVGAGALAYLAKKYAGEPFAEPVKDARHYSPLNHEELGKASRALGCRIDGVCGAGAYPLPDLLREAPRSRSAPTKSV